MSESPSQASGNAGTSAHDRVNALATRILSTFAVHNGALAGPAAIAFLCRLHAAVLSPDRDASLKVIALMQKAGISRDTISDIYVPAVAHVLGEQWCEDRLGFAAVTIGSARLQGLLRELGPEWRPDGGTDVDAPAILVVVAADVQHTLGALILSGQLRRRGFCVRMMLGASPDDMTLHLRQAQFDAVMISAALGDSVEVLRRLVTALRTALLPGTRIVVGGALTGAEAELASLTGADLATCDLDLALRYCGLAAEAAGMLDSDTAQDQAEALGAAQAGTTALRPATMRGEAPAKHAKAGIR